MTAAQPLPAAAPEIPLQPTSQEIWATKYQLKNHQGIPVDQTLQDTYCRVAWALASVEEDEKRNYWYDRFLWALENGAIPAGRIMSNAGASQHKSAVSLINCTVSRSLPDSMQGVLTALHDAGLTLKAGCGIGYEFSTLRPNGAYVFGAGAETNGPLAFMDIFDKMCFTVASAGGRRGAQMGTFDVSHPDVEAFIQAKREDGRLRQFNLSLLITDEFMQAVEADADWPLVFPVHVDEFASLDPASLIWKDWPVAESHDVRDDQVRVACKVYRTVKATELYDLIMRSTYDFAEPGFILIDAVNRMNPLWFCENIRATNPCGEQPLPPEGSCLLGSVNLARFVIDPFTPQARFDWDKYRAVVAIFTRMLDNVVEINGLPLPGQRESITDKRRHGMGFLGLGSALVMLGHTYGDELSLVFTDKVSQELALVGWRTGLELALEKGAAPALLRDYTLTAEHFRRLPELADQGYKPGDQVKGSVLHCLSPYMQRIAHVDPQLVAALQDHGCRFTHHSSIAPTGTISLALANNASNGIEPSFSHSYLRNVIVQGKKTKEQVEVQSYELLAYRTLIDPTATVENLPACFASSDSISPKAHVDIQAAAQYWVDSAISKTINVPTDLPFAEFQDIYRYAYQRGLKGCTTFRFNPEAFSGVLVKADDLANTHYIFELEDGSSLELRGDEKVFYEGEEHVAANLFDALKEGYYGKF